MEKVTVEFVVDSMGNTQKVDLSEFLQVWLYDVEKEVIFMSWNDALDAMEKEMWATWKNMEGDLGDTDTLVYTHIEQLKHLAGLRDELSNLARWEDVEGEVELGIEEEL